MRHPLRFRPEGGGKGGILYHSRCAACAPQERRQTGKTGLE